MHGRQAVHRQVLIFLVLGWLATAGTSVAAGQDEVRDRLARPIHSLLLEKESPVLGIRWSGELFVDAPIGSEPPDAAVTLRRAKLRFHRSLNQNWQAKLSADYTKGGQLELSDNYVLYAGWKTALLKLGIASPAFSLESVSDASGLTFMERALPVEALAEPKGMGVMLLKRTASSILNTSLLLFNHRQDNLTTSGQALVLHYVHAPLDIRGKDNVHLGASLSWRINADSSDTRFRSRPEIATANTFFVDTGPIEGASEVMRAGLEASRVSGRFSWQSELLSTRVRREASDAVHFWGAYLYASWFLTGDSRNYDLGQGQYVPVQVAAPVRAGGWGAFEVAARASYVDLQDSDVNGGRQFNLSLGLNWYLNNRLRLMGNVVKVLDVERPGSEFDGSDPLILAVRLQWLVQ
jgi:phosphate-selective porin OprO/OprP